MSPLFGLFARRAPTSGTLQTLPSVLIDELLPFPSFQFKHYIANKQTLSKAVPLIFK